MNKINDDEEIKRVQTLLSYSILDTPYEKDFDGLARLISIICDTPIALISLIDETRQWHKARVGLDARESPREETFCQYTILQDELLEIRDAQQDDRVKDNPHVKGNDGIRFYAGVPIKAKNGYNIGTVCVVDHKPKSLTPAQRDALKLLTRQVMLLLETRRKNENLSNELEAMLNKKIEAARQQLLQKESEYNYLLDAIEQSNGVIRFSPKGVILNVNKIFLSEIGYLEKELVGKHHSVLVEEDQIAFNREFWRSLEKGEFKTGRFKRRRKNGAPIWLQATYNPILDLEGNVTEVIKISQDITREKEAEQTLKNAKESAEFMNVQKDNFIANISHEIRTPIHAILGFTELLLDQEEDVQKKSHLKSVKTAGDNLLFLINDILDLSKIDAGEIQMEQEPFELSQVVQNVFSILHLKAKQKNIRFSYLLEEDLPTHLRGDRNRLSQILINLLGNAIKFTAAGKVELLISSIEKGEGTTTLEFRVRDTGTGIPRDKLGKIFQRFSQADESISRKYGGTGLGLNISKQLVEKQNGSISVSSELGKGSEFKFSIPYVTTGKEVEAKICSTVEQQQQVSPLKILLCEDNELNQRLTEAILREKGHTIQVAGNGNKGIELLKQQEFDLVLMDIQMPEKDGYQTTREIREHLNLDIPVIALTANFLAAERERCIKAGMNDYLSKPFSRNELMAVLSRWAEVELQVGEPEFSKDKGLQKQTLNLETLHELSGGNETFEIEMMQLFIEQAEKSIDELETLLRNDNIEGIKKVAHKLKSSYGIIGADTQNLHLLEDKPVDAAKGEVRDAVQNLKDELYDIFSILRENSNDPQ